MIVICDLDGTITDATHRQHLVQGEKKDFRAFYAAAHLDTPKNAIIHTLQALHHFGATIWIWSGRSDEVRGTTMIWLLQHDVPYSWLQMRRAGDYTPDDALKMSWFDGLPPEQRERVKLTLDDRDRMVKAWRARGITCFQVAPGDF